MLFILKAIARLLIVRIGGLLVLLFGLYWASLEGTLKKVLLWFMEQVLKAGAVILDQAGIQPPAFDPSTIWGGMPVMVLQMLGDLGVWEALSIIILAYGVRFMLQTVPFVRWGS